ncbi:MAG: hypothetical protein IK016_08815 [Lachnospiraceae bacterium]|nr:hypothetical protein [Lachnospiraceae bacterium]
MTEEKRQLMRERVNLRVFYLRLLKQLWILPVAALAGAVCGFLLYLGVTKLTQPLLYEAVAKIYVHYRENAQQELIYNNYNSSTWRDLLETEVVQQHLTEEDVIAKAEEAFRSNISSDADMQLLLEQAPAPRLDLRHEDEESVDVSVYSDVRILHVTGVSRTAETAAYRAMLYAEALMRYAEEDEVIRNTEVLGYTTPVPRIYPERRLIAAITGAILGALIAFFILRIRFILNNAIYVPEDANRRYGIPVLAVLPREGQGIESYPAQLKQELSLHIKELQTIGKKWLILRAQDTDVTNSVPAVADVLRKYADDTIEDDVILSEKSTAEVKTADVVLLEVRSGARLGEMYEHLIAEAAAGGNPVKGIILTGADNSFLKQYYRM